MRFPNYVMYVGIKGSAVALDRITGDIVWQTKLKGVGFVNLVCDEACIYATTAGEAFCLDPATGEIRWNNPLKGLGLGLASMLVPGSPSQQQQQLLFAEQQRRDQESSSASTSTTPGT